MAPSCRFLSAHQRRLLTKFATIITIALGTIYNFQNFLLKAYGTQQPQVDYESFYFSSTQQPPNNESSLTSRSTTNHADVVYESNENDVLTFDEHVWTNIQETYKAAKSYTKWVNSTAANSAVGDDLLLRDHTYFQTIPLMATVDRRPIIVNKQMVDGRNHHQVSNEDRVVLGCALTGSTFISNLDHQDVDKDYKKYVKPSCHVCFEFTDYESMTNFVPGILGYETIQEPSTEAYTKCFVGKATVDARFATWQRQDSRFQGYGYQWHVDCILPVNGVKELTCQGISNLQKKIIDNQRDDKDVQKIYFHTKIEMDGRFPTIQRKSNNSSSGADSTVQEREDPEEILKRFHIYTEWPWTGVISHGDDRSTIAEGLTKSWNDTKSKFVPSSYQEMTLAHVEGPGYDPKLFVEGNKSANTNNLLKSKGGIHPRLIPNLFHWIRNTPSSTHMIAVVDSQAKMSYHILQHILNTTVQDLFKVYGKRVFGDMMRSSLTKDSKGGLIPIMSMKNLSDVSSFRSSSSTSSSTSNDMTLVELFRIRNLNIHVVPIITPPSVFHKTVCGGQYTFLPYLAARYAADYQVIMYMDGDTALIEGSSSSNNNNNNNNEKRTRKKINEILYDRFFSTNSSKCAGHRMRLIEQYVKPEYHNNIEKVLQCTEDVALDEKKWNYAMRNCHLKSGNIVARTDSIHSFSIHHPDTLPDYLPGGVEDCITPGNAINSRYFLGEDEFVQVHLRDRERKPESACFVNHE